MRWGTTLFTTLAIALAVAPTAAAAAPANDNFANREVLPAGFPGGAVEVTRSNVGATYEGSAEGMQISPLRAGHSIWFEWEASAGGWTTVGACDSDFAAVLGVFTGTELGNLTRVAAGNGSEGPACSGGRQYTFRASAGTKYVIGVDGNAFQMPEAPPPVTEGSVVLRIEPTPPPANDDLADAALLSGSVSEEPNGARFYSAFVGGYNWTATTEPGEFLEGTSSGASVWYGWTPPETGTYRLGGPCCGTGLHWALFSGGFDAGHEVLAETEGSEAELIGGTPYRIAVYGTHDAGTGEPSMGRFSLAITATLTPGSEPAPGGGQPPAGEEPGPSIFSSPESDLVAPQTRIARSKLRAAAGSAKFWFSASEPTQAFFCQLDRGLFRPCASPKTYKHLKPGRHTFRVKSMDLVGNVDASPAVTKFKLPRVHRQRR